MEIGGGGGRESGRGLGRAEKEGEEGRSEEWRNKGSPRQILYGANSKYYSVPKTMMWYFL